MNERPLISVVIPTCGRLADLSRCLEALSPSRQGVDSGRFEVIVTDDRRSEGVRDCISRHFAWVRWAPGPAAGPAANRNNGARHARGRWLVFTDDDCIPSARWLAAYDEAISSGKSLALEGQVTSDPGPRTAWDEAPLNSTGGYFWSCNIAVEREVFWECGGFDENYDFAAMEDVDLRDSLALKGVTPAFVRAAVVNHPARTGGLQLRLTRLKQLRSHVYYRRKWGGPHPTREYLSLSAAIMRHWLLVPLRQRSLLLAAVAPIAWAYMTANFLPWYREASRRLEERLG